MGIRTIVKNGVSYKRDLIETTLQQDVAKILLEIGLYKSF